MKNYIYALLLLIITITGLGLGVTCSFLYNHTIDFSSLQQDVMAKPSVLLDVHGNVWGTFALDKREYVSLESMPDHLIQAFLITEDRNFFNHSGISIRGIIRSLFVNLVQGKKMQGASTITQQLVRSMFLHNKKTFIRKIIEQWYAILVERSLTKEQILEAYLNNVYFGYGTYGVQAACKKFWNKPVAEISLARACVLAGIMKSPQYYNPIRSLKNSIKRRNLIIDMLYNNKYCSESDRISAIEEPLIIQRQKELSIAPYAQELLRQELEQKVGRYALYTQGYVIQTTLDSTIQQEANLAFKRHVKSLRATISPLINGGLISLDSKTGQIRAMVGGYDYFVSKYNRATQARRQLGSVFKAFVYAAALEQGLGLEDVEIDEPFEMQQGLTVWRPENYDKVFRGPMTRAFALSHSNNIVTIKTLLKVGVENVIDVACRCGITQYMPAVPSLALGCVDVTVTEAAASFNTIVNHGMYVEPHMILWIKNKYGQKIYKHSSNSYQAIDSRIAEKLTRVFSFSMNRLQQIVAHSDVIIESVGKTGTTNDARTCWFCGATPTLTTAMYIGCDYNQSMGQNSYGSRVAFPIWWAMHSNIAKSDVKFYYNPDLQEKFIHCITGQIMKNDKDPDVVPLLI